MKSSSSLALALVALVLPLSPMSLFAVDIVGHRGASYDAPENTLASEKLAWKDKADAVELDIHLSKDGHLPVMHDFNTKRITGRDAEVKDLTIAELKTLDAGSHKGAQFAGEKIPTLEEMIALIPPGKRLFVEIKTGPEIVPALKHCLETTGADAKKITIISFNYESLKEVRKQLPAYTTLYLAGYKKPNPKKPDATPQPTLDELVAQAKAANLSGLDLQQTWPMDAAAAKKIKDAGLQLHVWTVDDPAVARRWISFGADGVTTNRAGWMREQLGM